MTEFTPASALVGGLLIGLASVLLMLLLGRIAGVTGIILGAWPGAGRDWRWRAAFLAGMLVSPIAFELATGRVPAFLSEASPALLAASGLVTGFGVVLGSGCPSGHGICGLARFSNRSLVAVPVFMTTAALTVFVMRHLLAG
jgi:hypothetical protein